ncbi:MAG: methyltransferase [Phycisphaeraceae bacterium]|nr:methyltransferase [Phycisphaeraceae bacterium]
MSRHREDRYYSPADLARVMVENVTMGSPSIVADFAAGDGGLLIPAESRWPGARIVACDIDSRAVARLRRRRSSWLVGRSDFLKDRSVEATRHLPALWGCVDVILLNPPFSMRGGQRWESRIGQHAVTTGVAMAFLFRALPFLSSGGQLISVLPESCLHSERDAEAMERLRHCYSVEELCRLGRGRFDRCAARTVVLKVTQNVRVSSRIIRRVETDALPWNVMRGSAQMHSLRIASRRTGFTLVHTDNLRGSTVVGPHKRVWSTRPIRGSVVLLPRVGRTTLEKVVVLQTTRPIVLSDCVMAIECESVAEAHRVHQMIAQHWSRFQKCYGGTGAPYTTVEKIRLALRACMSGLNQAPEWPKPPVPRIVGGRSGASIHVARATGEITS